MTATAKVRRPALRYHGGKWMIAPWIISWLVSGDADDRDPEQVDQQGER